MPTGPGHRHRVPSVHPEFDPVGQRPVRHVPTSLGLQRAHRLVDARSENQIQLRHGVDGSGPRDEPHAAVDPLGADVVVDVLFRPIDAPAERLDRRLRKLEDWSGDCHRISRTVLLPQEWIEPLRRRVDRAQQDLDHHVRTEGVDGGVRFVAWTRSIDAVTELDLALAARIDEAVRTL